MSELDDTDSPNTPFINLEIDEEYFQLLQQKTIFDTNIKEINQLTQELSFEDPSNIQLLKSKFENIKILMNKISTNINYLQNIIPEDNFDMNLKIKILLDDIHKEFKKEKKKLNNSLINAQNCLQEDLSFISDFSTQEKSSDNSISNKEKINKFGKIKKEYEEINAIKNSLNQLNDEIKFNSINQEDKINIVDINMSYVEDSVNNENKKLEKLDENGDNNNFYYKVSLGIGIGILMLFIIIYTKFGSASKIRFDGSI